MNPPGRRQEDDVNLVAYALRPGLCCAPASNGNYIAGPLGGGNDGIGRRSEDDPNLVTDPYTFDWQVAGSERTWIHDTPKHSRSLTKTKTLAVHEQASVRRLTPRECERLQGLPDDWTLLDPKTPDSRRYSSLGDAVTANVAQWIGERLMAHG